MMDGFTADYIREVGSLFLVARDKAEPFIPGSALGGSTQEERDFYRLQFDLYEAFYKWGADGLRLTLH